jgi:3-methyladenine DNA glycosylase AlkD
MSGKVSTGGAKAARADLKACATAERAAAVARYFKTGKGEYGEGDVFIGVSVPDVRKVARAHDALTLEELDDLLRSRIHEERSLSLFVLTRRFERSKAPDERRAIFELYLSRLDHVNNWDLVDSSAPQIVGGWLASRRDRRLLDRLAGSKHLWSRRVAMLATLQFIRAGESADALRLAEKLLGDDHDLMHKAVGWMLREVGERVSVDTLRAFLRTHAAKMPRTALRYAIEKLPEPERKAWLSVPRSSRATSSS